MGDAIPVPQEARVIGEIGTVEHVATQRLELTVVAACQSQGRIRRREDLVRYDGGMRVAVAPRVAPGIEMTRRHIRQEGDGAVEERDVDVLPPAVAFPREQRGQDRLSGIHARGEVGYGDAELHRRALGLASDRHQAALGLDGEIVPSFVGSGTGPAVARDGAVDEPPVRGHQRFGIEPEALQGAGTEILDEHVCLLRQRPYVPLPLLGPQIDFDRLLQPVAAQEIGRIAVDLRRHPAARVVAPLGRLDLPDLRTKIRERLRATRAGEDATEIQNADPLERRAGHQFPSVAQNASRGLAPPWIGISAIPRPILVVPLARPAGIPFSRTLVSMCPSFFPGSRGAPFLAQEALAARRVEQRRDLTAPTAARPALPHLCPRATRDPCRGPQRRED